MIDQVISDSMLEGMANIQYLTIALTCVKAPPSKALKFLLSKFKVDPNLDADECQKALQEKGREILTNYELALTESGKDFLCGDEPGVLDCKLVPKLYLFYNFAESGFADFGWQGHLSRVFPQTWRYMHTFSKRRSWIEAYGTSYIRQLDVALLRTNCVRLVNACPTLMDICIRTLEKARKNTMHTIGRRSTLSRRSNTDRSSVASLCL